MKEILIPAENYEKLQVKMNRMNNKAKKLGMNKINMEVLGEEYIKSKKEEGVYNKYVNVGVEGKLPKIKGWELIAKVEHNPSGNVFKSMEDIQINKIPQKYKESNSECEHCNVNRHRVETFLIHNKETNDWKQVGRSCLADFLRDENVEKLFNLYTQLVDMTEEEEQIETSNEKKYVVLFDYLCVVEDIVRKEGFITKTMASEQHIESTSEKALRRYFRQSTSQVGDGVRDKVKKALSWVGKVNKERANQYMYNLHVLCENEYLDVKNTGMVASLILAYEKYQKINEEKEREKDFQKSEYVGEIKERKIFKLKLYKVIMYEGFYGIGFLHIYHDENDNVFVWSTGKKQGIEGEEYELKGTIKEHKEYNGVKQTVITRCKIQ